MKRDADRIVFVLNDNYNDVAEIIVLNMFYCETFTLLEAAGVKADYLLLN